MSLAGLCCDLILFIDLVARRGGGIELKQACISSPGRNLCAIFKQRAQSQLLMGRNTSLLQAQRIAGDLRVQDFRCITQDPNAGVAALSVLKTFFLRALLF